MTDIVVDDGVAMPIRVGPVQIDDSAIAEGAAVASKFSPGTLQALLYSATVVGCMVYVQLVVGPTHITMLGEKLAPLTKAIESQVARNDKHIAEQNAILREALKLSPAGNTNGASE